MMVDASAEKTYYVLYYEKRIFETHHTITRLLPSQNPRSHYYFEKLFVPFHYVKRPNINPAYLYSGFTGRQTHILPPAVSAECSGPVFGCWDADRHREMFGKGEVLTSCG